MRFIAQWRPACALLMVRMVRMVRMVLLSLTKG
jgi:hypothetical protein